MERTARDTCEPDIGATLDVLEGCARELEREGFAPTARLLGMAILHLRCQINGISERELDAFCDQIRHGLESGEERRSQLVGLS